MNLTEWLQRLMTNFGAQWVMWLLIGLSVISVAIMLERAWFYWSLRDDLGRLANDLRDMLRNGDIEGARIGRDVQIRAEARKEDRDGEGWYIRDGIVVVPKNGVIPDKTVI